MVIDNISNTRLSNGLRVLVEPVDYVKSAAIGLWIGTGSRYETASEAGISHLIEHMMFKGTKSRTAKQIAEEIESSGGSLNAFTDKEFTCYYARVLSEDVADALDVLSDMVLNSLHDPEELEREEMVVLEEIKRHEDQPEELVHDLFMQTAWGEHPLALPVIGTAESVSAIRRDDILKYLNRRYAPNRIVISVAGNVDPEMILRFAESQLGQIDGTSDMIKTHAPTVHKESMTISRDIESVHFCLGGAGFSQHEDDKYTIAVMDTILGGSMSSRLFQEIREKRGLVYAIGSYAVSYAEGGVIVIYGGTSMSNFEQVKELSRIEMDKFCQEPLPEDEVEKAKNQLRGNMVLGLEGMSNRMTRMAKNELYFERIIPIEETVEKINAVTTADIHRIAQVCLNPNKMALTTIGPFES